MYVCIFTNPVKMSSFEDFCGYPHITLYVGLSICTTQVTSKTFIFYSKPYLLVDVPVQAGVFQHHPVLLPLLRKVALGILLLPEPACTISLSQIFTGNPTLADGR